MSTITLYEALEILAEDSQNAESFLRQYQQTREHLEENMYPWVQANCSWFTDHGEKHIDAVINQASRLLQDEIRNPIEGDLEELDIFVILTSILWHDVGMIAYRGEHEKISTEVSERFKEIAFPTTGVKGVIDDIIKAHRNPTGLDIPQKSTTFNHSGEVYKLYPKALAGILRFADEISETQGRVSSDTWVQDVVPPESKIFWRYAQSIQGCHPHINGKTVILNMELTRSQAVETYPCPDSFEDRANQKGKISLIEYIVCRLEKLVNELSYCERYFNRYVEIREVDLDLIIRDQNRDVVQQMEERIGAAGLTTQGTYPNVTIYNEFFDQYSEWKPEELDGCEDSSNPSGSAVTGGNNDD